MKAIAYSQPQPIEHPEALIDIELAKPVAQGRDILVKVQAVSVNPVDTKVRASAAPEKGQYKVIGWDAVGEVVAVGESVEFFKVGEQVFYAGDITRSGSNAEFQLVDERIVGRKPKSISNSQAAERPLTSITAWEPLYDRSGFTPKLTNLESAATASIEEGAPRPSILIVGAAGGVGSILTQPPSKPTDAVVSGTASRQQSKDWVLELRGGPCDQSH